MTGPRLIQAPWLNLAPVRAVMAALGGDEGATRFVGGCVRNAVRGEPVSDIDLATRLVPDEVVARLEAAGLKAVPTGLSHGTVTAVALGQPFEVTTLRTDVATYGRHADVAYTEDWTADARRRDFTMNALYADHAGRLFDPLGTGIDDAAAGHVRFIGDAVARIREDYLRILRFFRFHAWYGDDRPDKTGLKACADERAGLTRLSAERVQAEVLKLLAAPDPRDAVQAMAATGVLAEVLPEAGSLARFDRLCAIDQDTGFDADPELRLAALLHGTDASAVANRLKLSNALSARLRGALGDRSPLSAALSEAGAKALIYRWGTEPFADRLRLAWANAPDPDNPCWRVLFDLSRSWAPPSFPLTGNDVIAAGIPPGPDIGRILMEVESWWIENGFPKDSAALKARLAEAVAGRFA